MGKEEAFLKESIGGTRLPKHGGGGLFSSRKEMNDSFSPGRLEEMLSGNLAILLGASLHLNPLNIRDII